MERHTHRRCCDAAKLVLEVLMFSFLSPVAVRFAFRSDVVVAERHMPVFAEKKPAFARADAPVEELKRAA
ncbi:hypothetical protein [Novosphingobium sp. P6W]|uniref:hypothetical protein n=1 Tax=Novosphingobium sp. P6W TaxID=1609758 RepID=UPI0013B3DDCB|nr:hypothetical protein [Novosphingobium sp. P6W]